MSSLLAADEARSHVRRSALMEHSSNPSSFYRAGLHLALKYKLPWQPGHLAMCKVSPLTLPLIPADHTHTRAHTHVCVTSGENEESQFSLTHDVERRRVCRVINAEGDRLKHEANVRNPVNTPR